MVDKRLVDLFLELARLDGVSGREKPVADFAVSFLKGLSLDACVDGAAAASGSDTGNVVCRVGGGGDRVLLCHMDTARPTKDTRQTVLADRISSDGKSQLGVDNRAGIAVLLYSVEKAVRQGLPMRPFTLALSTQEETTMGGSINLKLDAGIRMGFVFDSSLDPGCFATCSPGAAVFTADVRGKPSHAGIAPEKGVDAIAVAARALAALKFGRIDEETTANVGTIQGGEATNVVPASVRLRGEARSLDISKVPPVLEGIRAEFEKASRAAGAATEFSWQWDFKPYKLSPDSEVYRLAAEAVRGAGLEPRPVPSHGGSDANNLNANGVPTVNFGIGAKNPHADDEYILLEDLRKAADIAWQLMKAGGS